MTPSIYIVTALAAEARPLCDNFRLKRIQEFSEFREIYVGERTVLAVSGIGKSASAATVGYLFGRFPSNGPAVWMNAGIAGHGSMQLGEVFIAHSITDRATDRTWYPSRVVDHNYSSSRLVTVDQPEENYEDAVAYDMEASGYYPAACRASTSELVQCCKVVSDNPDSVVARLNEAMVTDLIAAQVPVIAEIIEMHHKFAASNQAKENVTEVEREYLDRWHFTATQRVELHRLLVKLHTLKTRISVHAPLLKDCQDAGAVLRKMKAVHQSFWHRQLQDV